MNYSFSNADPPHIISVAFSNATRRNSPPPPSPRKRKYYKNLLTYVIYYQDINGWRIWAAASSEQNEEPNPSSHENHSTLNHLRTSSCCFDCRANGNRTAV